MDGKASGGGLCLQQLRLLKTCTTCHPDNDNDDEWPRTMKSILMKTSTKTLASMNLCFRETVWTFSYSAHLCIPLFTLSGLCDQPVQANIPAKSKVEHSQYWSQCQVCSMLQSCEQRVYLSVENKCILQRCTEVCTCMQNSKCTGICIDELMKLICWNLLWAC